MSSASILHEPNFFHLVPKYHIRLVSEPGKHVSAVVLPVDLRFLCHKEEIGHTVARNAGKGHHMTALRMDPRGGRYGRFGGRSHSVGLRVGQVEEIQGHFVRKEDEIEVVATKSPFEPFLEIQISVKLQSVSMFLVERSGFFRWRKHLPQGCSLMYRCTASLEPSCPRRWSARDVFRTEQPTFSLFMRVMTRLAAGERTEGSS